MVYNDDGKKKKKKPGFNAQAFKHAISMIESSGGKFLDNKYSSAAGKYHFLYNSIKNDPSMKGVSKQEFMNRPELQESIMDKALNGELENYPYGESYANKLQKKYNSKYNVNELSALVHFLGPGNARKFLKDPDTFKVPGKRNATGQEYLSKFQGFFDEYNVANAPKPKEQPVIKTNTSNTSPKRNEEKNLLQPIDNTKVVMPEFKHKAEPVQNPSELIYNLDLNKTNAQDQANEFNQGGNLNSKSSVEDLVTIFEGGGTHEQNPNGGIPQGTGANGKPNLVEEGETKWNDYIFSNAFSLDGTFTGKDGKSSNVFAEGGSLDPDPSPKEEVKPLTLTKQNHPTNPSIIEEVTIPDVREQNMTFDGPTLNQTVDFKSRNTGAGTDAFLNRYNDPITRQRLKDQAGLSESDIDNMILKGMGAEKQVGGNSKGSKASYANDKIFMGEKYQDNVPVESHERVHASNIDAAMGLPLAKILGNAFHQEGKSFLKKNSPETLNYLNQPHEAYGNFNEFRESLGMKPGEQIDKARLKKLVKEKGLGMENFYRAYNDDKIVEALNTIAFQDNNNNNNNQEYRIS